jgi:transposase
VPQDHLLRKIDRFLELSDLHQHLAPYYSHTGRPSIDPELIIRMLIMGIAGGADLDIDLFRLIAEDLANSTRWPQWKAGSEFKAVREESAGFR